MNGFALAENIYRVARERKSFFHYTGILNLQAMERLAHLSGDAAHRELLRQDLEPFLQRVQEWQSRCNIENYRLGGNGAAAACLHGFLPELTPLLEAEADIYFRSPRNGEGILAAPYDPERAKIWIDVAWAACPWALYAGLVLDRDDLIDDACHQIMSMHDLFLDSSCGLLHQARGFNGAGQLSQDHWSRGNGWGLMALAALAEDLPASHPRRDEIRQAFTSILAACIAVQDDDGMWHQELTRHDSFVETSGSGLIASCLGVAIQLGCAPAGARTALERALTGYLGYIAYDHSIFNCCVGCLAPDDGSIEAYMAKAHVKDDPHAFGPAILAFAQAQSLGIDITLQSEELVPQGCRG